MQKQEKGELSMFNYKNEGYTITIPLPDLLLMNNKRYVRLQKRKLQNILGVLLH